jgi:hypothetical protein
MVTGHLREHCTMETAPSCIGYKFVGGKAVPVFDPADPGRQDKNTADCQAAALRFAADFASTFGDMSDRLPFRHYEACLPFEHFLHYAPREDLNIFKAVEFDDDFGTGRVNLVDITLSERENMNDPGLLGRIRELEDRIRVLLGSWTWRTGRMIVAPFGKIKKIVKKD